MKYLSTMFPQQALFLLALVGIVLQFVDGGRSSGGGVSTGDPTTPWPGHLEPLGSKAIKRPVPVLESFPSPREFYVNHVLASLPVVFRNGAKLSPAFTSWSDKNLKLRPEAETTIVDVEIRKKEDRKQPGQRMKFREFLERYETEDEYMVETLPNFLRDEVIVPPPLVCDDILQRIADAVIWFSSGGTKSHLHNDDKDNINCLFSGQKDVLFLNYTQYRHQFPLDHPEGSYSGVDVDRVDMNKYPGLRNVEFYKAKLFPGDCLYIPYKWLHQVNSMGRNIAVNVWFDHSCEKEPSPEICGDTDRKLTIADVQLGEERPLDFEEDFEEDAPTADEELIKTLKNEKLQRFTLEDFTVVLQKRVPMLNDLTWTEECDAISEQAFDLLDLTEDGILDKDDFAKLNAHDEMFHFNLEWKLFMLSDIAHEQAVQEKLRIYELDKKNNKPSRSENPDVTYHEVEPLNLDDIDWGDDGKKGSWIKDEKVEIGKKKGDTKKDGKRKEDLKLDERQNEETKSADRENKLPKDINLDEDSTVDIKVEL